MKHIHHDLIAEWIKDTTRPVQLQRERYAAWEEVVLPQWYPEYKYRFKHQPKPDVVRDYVCSVNGMMPALPCEKPTLRHVFDGETGKLKSAEVLT